MNYQRFLSQLEVAIAQQEKSLVWHENNVSLSQAAWQQAYARLEGLRKLVQRYREDARKSADKQEQKLLDEMAQRLMAQHTNKMD
jgi:flagellar FliJ protein